MRVVTVDVEQTWIAEFRYWTGDRLAWAPGAVFSDAEAGKQATGYGVESGIVWREVGDAHWDGQIDGYDRVRLYKVPVDPAGIMWAFPPSPPEPSAAHSFFLHWKPLWRGLAIGFAFGAAFWLGQLAGHSGVW